eukprot:s2295_g2.t1
MRHVILKVGSSASIEQQIGGGDAFGQAILDVPMAAALAIYALGIVWFTFGLCAYHNYLVCTNQTTYEQIKGAFTGMANPFHRGILSNYWAGSPG